MSATDITTNGLPSDPAAHRGGLDAPRRVVLGAGGARARSWSGSSPRPGSTPAGASSCASPGATSTAQIGHVPVVVVRTREGELRGFVNVCRHRGHLVASGEGCGCRETLQCPYHAWTYPRRPLRARPVPEREPGFDASTISLLPVAVDTWGPFVFVNPDPEAGSLADALGELPAAVAASGLDLDALRFHSHGR